MPVEKAARALERKASLQGTVRHEVREEGAYLCASFRLSRGERNNGFDDRMAVMLRIGSRHLKMAPRTSIFASRRSTGMEDICRPDARSASVQ